MTQVLDSRGDPPPVYATAISMCFDGFAVRMNFLSAVPDVANPERNAYVQSVARVVISPDLARRLFADLSNIESTLKAHGKVNNPLNPAASGRQS